MSELHDMPVNKNVAAACIAKKFTKTTVVLMLFSRYYFVRGIPTWLLCLVLIAWQEQSMDDGGSILAVCNDFNQCCLYDSA